MMFLTVSETPFLGSGYWCLVVYVPASVTSATILVWVDRNGAEGLPVFYLEGSSYMLPSDKWR